MLGANIAEGMEHGLTEMGELFFQGNQEALQVGTVTIGGQLFLVWA